MKLGRFTYQRAVDGYMLIHRPERVDGQPTHIMTVDDVQAVTWFAYRLNAWLDLVQLAEQTSEYLQVIGNSEAEESVARDYLQGVVSELDEILELAPAAPYELFEERVVVFLLLPHQAGVEFTGYCSDKQRSILLRDYTAWDIWLTYRMNAFWIAGNWRNRIATALETDEAPTALVERIYNEFMQQDISAAPNYEEVTA